MKIALCQINSIVGNFKYNSDKILSFYTQAVETGADLVVFPELCITGYPPMDLLLENSFIRQNLKAIEKVSSHIKKIPAIAGFVRKVDSRIYNSAAVMQNSRISATYDKILLPTYDVFDEKRHFTNGSTTDPIPILIAGETVMVGIQICEDLWDHKYECKVTDQMVTKGAELIINISSSPLHVGKRTERIELITNKVKYLKVPFLYCNLVGGQDELIFDGHSLAYDADGNLIAEGKQFEEEIISVDVNKEEVTIRDAKPFKQEEEIFSALVLGVRDYFKKTGHEKCIIGLSGGIDSALTACIAVEALGSENVTFVAMPSKFSSKASVDDAAKLAENLGVKLLNIPIDDLMLEYDDVLKNHFDGLKQDITEENIQARIRGNILMAFSNKFGCLVLSTGNKTELALGYCTLYGDMSGGLAVISDLNKLDVYSTSKWYNKHKKCEVIPKNIIDKIPSAELSKGQVDPFDYQVVSPLVDNIVEQKKSRRELIDSGYDPKLVDHTINLVKRAEFKRRQAPPGLRVTTKAFGIGRRYPIVNHFHRD